MTRRMRNRMSRLALAAIASFGAVTTTGCARNPVTGEREIALISEAQEIQMGQQAAQEVAQSLGLVQDEALQQYVQRVGSSLAKDSERGNLPWTFRVVDDPTPNAFALPGGFIFVTRGMMNLMDSEAELATVLGHEIGHVTARHSVSQISRAQLAQLGLGIGMIFSEQLRNYQDVVGTGLQLLFLKYGRDDERQSDELGFKYALNEGYDVSEMADVFQSLQRVGAATGRSPLPSWMSTHPDPGERVETARRRVAALDRPVDNLKEGASEYMTRLNGLTYGENPRDGFFEGSVFYHPELRFQLTFPQGWQMQNTAQAVVAVSPRQDAIIQLTLAGTGDPTTTARRFLSQQGVQEAQSTTVSINGIPAVASYFQAQTEQGVLRGLATFLTYGGRTYQVLAYSGAQGFSQYDGLFRQSVGSFSQVTDQRVLNAQPNRINVVRLQQAMTLAEFNQRHPSVIPIEQLALINQVDSPTATMPAGSYRKQVVTGGAVAGEVVR